MKQQPSVILYFDVRESIAHPSYEEKGMLRDAILDYGQICHLYLHLQLHLSLHPNQQR